MNNFILNFKHDAPDLASSLNIEKDRLDELANEFGKLIQEHIDNDGDLSISIILEQIASLDITNEEYTFMILQLGMMLKDMQS